MEMFHPLIQKWFYEKVGTPTDIQEKAWPVIASGENALIIAPTGSGKTLTAFLWAVNKLATGAWESGKTSVLYISPMKALNNDIQKNLLSPVSEIAMCFKNEGISFPVINVLTRSGDTPGDERRRMNMHPPEILITTPESLNIILTSRNSRSILTGLKTVILDEIHAVIGSKRGTHLITAVDRLVPLCGEFQRIALSATVRPVDPAADFTAGYRMSGNPPDYIYTRRSITIISSGIEKEIRLSVTFPENSGEKKSGDSFWAFLSGEFRKIIMQHKSTLFFANNRQLTEKIARLINENQEGIIAYSHHSAISKELRLEVENKLKKGELRAIIATSTLELGIDIGDLDEVVLVQTPFTISSALQRIGRAGHRVNESSTGRLFPTYGKDFITAAVIAGCVRDKDIEPVIPVECPLDVLSQLILSMASPQLWDIDELFGQIKSSYPYRNLSRKNFDLVIEMLSGRYADSKIKELYPRVNLDKLDNTIKTKKGSVYLLYISGGTIPDRGYYNLRVQTSGSKIGELDEEFVWERRVGENFSFGNHAWKIQNITHNDVEVVPVKAPAGIVPFWKAEEIDRNNYFSEKIALFLEMADRFLYDPRFKDILKREYLMDDTAAGELASFLKSQAEYSKCGLPHRHHIVVECCRDPEAHEDSSKVIIHNFWGGKLNRPLAYAISSAWEEKYKYGLEILPSNDSIMILLPHNASTYEIMSLVKPENVERLLRNSLESTGFFGARFRENAGRALLLPKSDFKRRVPLWSNRLRSKKLLESVITYPDFPMLLETWRTCLQDDFDLPGLKLRLAESASGEIKTTEIATMVPSPFCDDIVWKGTNKYMYSDDTADIKNRSNLSNDLLKDIVFSSGLRPKIPTELSMQLTDKLHRTFPGYAPGNPDDLMDFIRDRIIIPGPEWAVLLKTIDNEKNGSLKDWMEKLGNRIIEIILPGSEGFCVCALENLERILNDNGYTVHSIVVNPVREGQIINDISFRHKVEQGIMKIRKRRENPVEHPVGQAGYPLELLSDWLSFYGPVELDWIVKTLGIKRAILDEIAGELAESRKAVVDILLEGSLSIEICSSDNLERLMRMARESRRPIFEALPLDYLQLYLASWQGLTNPAGSIENMQARIEQLFGYPAPAAAWEEYILPGRLAPYYPAWLDSLILNSSLMWFGCGKEKAAFAFSDDIDLFIEKKNLTPDFLPGTGKRYSFFELLKHSGTSSGELTEILWKNTWKSMITSDSFEVVRKGILNNFKPFIIEEMGKRHLRSGYSRWTSSRPLPGDWYEIEGFDPEPDLMEKQELVKERARVIFSRYGIVFRELLSNELPLLKWGSIFPALRLMELSGEILSGYFFEGIPGPQFISFEAYRILQDGLDEDTDFYINSTDPASLSGTSLENLKGSFPRRVVSNSSVFHGKTPVIISRMNGKDIDVKIKPGDARLVKYLEFLGRELSREFNPLKAVKIETINGEDAARSAYSEALHEFGFVGNYRELTLWKKY